MKITGNLLTVFIVDSVIDIRNLLVLKVLGIPVFAEYSSKIQQLNFSLTVLQFTSNFSLTVLQFTSNLKMSLISSLHNLSLDKGYIVTIIMIACALLASLACCCYHTGLLSYILIKIWKFFHVLRTIRNTSFDLPPNPDLPPTYEESERELEQNTRFKLHRVYTEVGAYDGNGGNNETQL